MVTFISKTVVITLLIEIKITHILIMDPKHQYHFN